MAVAIFTTRSTFWNIFRSIYARRINLTIVHSTSDRQIQFPRIEQRAIEQSITINPLNIWLRANHEYRRTYLDVSGNRTHKSGNVIRNYRSFMFRNSITVSRTAGTLTSNIFTTLLCVCVDLVQNEIVGSRSLIVFGIRLMEFKAINLNKERYMEWHFSKQIRVYIIQSS